MKKFIAIRHGESEANIKGIFSAVEDKYPLTERGVLQVQHSAKQLTDLDLNGILCSPVLRARQTAEIASKILGIPCTVDRRLRETDLQTLEGKPVRVMTSVDREYYRIETWQSHIDRMLECVRSRQGSYLLVSHALPIRAIMSYYLNIGEEDSSRGIDIGYASLSAVVTNPVRVISVGAGLVSDNFRKLFESF